MTEAGKLHAWRATGAPTESALTEDIWFANQRTGWAVNSSGQILRTDDAGETWQQQACFPDSYLRCIAFSGVRTGWIGALSPERRILRTRDGGASWEEIDLPSDAPQRVAAIFANDRRTLLMAGTTYPDEGATIARSTDGGDSWTAVDMRRYADTLHDMLFINPRVGWAVGGFAPDGNYGANPLPAILRTDDGGSTWRRVPSAAAMRRQGIAGEIAGKIARIGSTGVAVSLTSPNDAAIMRSDDGGKSWRRMRVGAGQRNLDGVGFLDGDHGWIGGCGDLTFVGGEALATSDGGASWLPEPALHRLTRVRFVGRRPASGYAAGDTISKLSSANSMRPQQGNSRRASRAIEAAKTASIGLRVPAGAHFLAVTCWERGGRIVRSIVQEQEPTPGDRLVAWDLTDADGVTVADGLYIIRITIDQHVSSRMLFKSS